MAKNSRTKAECSETPKCKLIKKIIIILILIILIIIIDQLEGKKTL